MSGVPMNLLVRLVAIWRREHGEPLVVPSTGSGLSRRRFLGLLGSSAAVAAAAPLVDLEALIWTPGQQIVVPAVTGGFVTIDWITQEALRMLEYSLTLAKQIDREYSDRYEGQSRYGVQVVLPALGGLSQREAHTRIIEPAVELMSQKLCAQGAAEFTAPHGIPPGVAYGVTHRNDSGAGMRGLVGYDIRGDRDILQLEVDSTTIGRRPHARRNRNA